VARIEDAFEALKLPSQANLDRPQIYQKVLYLKPKLYRLFLLVNDAKSNNSGTIDTRLEVKRFPEGNLSASSLIMADYLDALPPRAVDSQYRIGNLKVRPRVKKEFKQSEDMWLFAQVYGLKLDDKTHKPNVETEVLITRDGQEVKKFKEEINDVVGAASQMNFKQQLDMKEFEPGVYQVQVKITDKLASSPLVLPAEKFTVTK
jgi:hypothetical protein